MDDGHNHDDDDEDDDSFPSGRSELLNKAPPAARTAFSALLCTRTQRTRLAGRPA